jgi:hypothetical protein
MKNIALVLLVVSTILTVLSTTAEARRWRHFRHARHSRVAESADDSVVVQARKESPCEAQRVVEMRNAILAAHVLCKETITGSMYDNFVIRNRKRIGAANKTAVDFHMKKYGNRRIFDKLDTVVMNRISIEASKNPPYFCSRMESLAPLLTTLNVDELLKRQTQLEVPTCD